MSNKLHVLNWCDAQIITFQDKCFPGRKFLRDDSVSTVK